MLPERRLSGRNEQGGASRPFRHHSGAKAINPKGLGTESPSKTTIFDGVSPVSRVRALYFCIKTSRTGISRSADRITCFAASSLLSRDAETIS
jgi:hypothetical protein